ncbi:hypothetical protein BDN70DRAFT_815524 [Pholiota conissans]|uniref:Uncharacterized protein n=1 Tax=Pholiota conissans TaxID=109636 RepID=A0A9P5YSV9_9AGAR|nr:hypothetical protein BDN70DRAFT_815524 [Pholiota conissans]
MPQQPDSATRKSLNTIDDSLEGRKLRVAGRVLAYDAPTGLVVLIDKGHGLLVDVELSLGDGAESAVWVTERLSTIMVIGHLERTPAPLPMPAAMPANAGRVKLNRKLVLRAILVVPTPDLDLALWNSVLQDEERERH